MIVQNLYSRVACLSLSRMGFNSYSVGCRTFSGHQSKDHSEEIPVKPKKPLTPFFKYMSVQKPLLRKANPDLKVTDLTKKCAEMWNSLKPDEKSQYEADYSARQQDYSDAIKEFYTNLTEEQKAAIDKANAEADKVKKLRKHKQKIRENNKPKRPVTSYMMYVMEQAKESNQKLSDILSSSKGNWEKLDPAVKAKYTERYATAREEYHRELEKWEAKMFKEKKFDLIRSKSLQSTMPDVSKELKRIEKLCLNLESTVDKNTAITKRKELYKKEHASKNPALKKLESQSKSAHADHNQQKNVADEKDIPLTDKFKNIFKK